MPDISAVISYGAVAWLYLPLAVALGALHALEPGHAKSLMAAYIVAIRGTAGQATLLAISAAVGHTIVVWILALLALLFGEKYIVEQAEPWLWTLSGVLIVLLAVRLLWSLGRHSHAHGHDHHHDHPHGHKPAATADIIWFGFSGGLMPCPAAIAVLLVCIHLKAFALGVAMVAAFSVGLALTLVLIGIAAAWGAHHAVKRWPWLDRVADKAPYASAGLMLIVGLFMTVTGVGSINAANTRK